MTLYRPHLTDAERINRHTILYGEMPPATRLGRPQEMNTMEINENMNLILLVCGIGGAWIFLDYILPRLMDK